MQDLRIRATLAVATGLAVLCAAAPAALGATVSVRVEGQSQTLVRTLVDTTTTPVNKDGDPAHTCTGTSAAGALEVATGGDWNGSWFGNSYAVQMIKGETYDFSTPDFWSFWINNRGSSEGVCAVEAAQGDEILFFVDRCEYDPAIDACKSPPVLPLGLVDAPARVERGRPFTVRVIRYAQDGQTAPVGGATVAGGGASATTGSDGIATLALQTTGNVVLRAERQGFARSDVVSVCVFDPAAGGCAVAPPATAGPAGGGGAALDTSLPVASVVGIRDGQRFALRRAPRLLRGTVSPGGAGLHRVRFRLRRAVGRRCWFYSAVRERFRRGRCAATWFYYGLGDRPRWEYLLPSRLGPGRYALDVRVMDKWGREVTRRVVFTVLRARR